MLLQGFVGDQGLSGAHSVPRVSLFCCDRVRRIVFPAMMESVTMLVERPSHRAGKERNRVHPYRRSNQEFPHHQLRLTRCSDGFHGSSNGHTQTLSTGLNGVLPTTAIPQPMTPELLDQPAVSLIDLQTAGRQVQEKSGASHKGITESEDSSWGVAGTAEEIVWAPGKSTPQIAISLQRLAQEAGSAMAARVAPEVATEVLALLPDAKYSSTSKSITVSAAGKRQKLLPGTVAIISDEPADSPVVEEARLACSALGCYAYQLGGSSKGNSLSNLLPNLSAVQSAAVVIVIAREVLTLPAVVAGAVQTPVVAVPSGDGSDTIVNAPGVCVVDRANGVAAAIFAARILQFAARLREPPSSASGLSSNTSRVGA